MSGSEGELLVVCVAGSWLLSHEPPPRTGGPANTHTHTLECHLYQVASQAQLVYIKSMCEYVQS